MPLPAYMKHRQKKRYAYVPPPNSGAHVILVSMFRAEQNEFIKNMTKQQVLDYCTKYSQSALKDNSKIWACMKGLIDKSLLGRQIARDPLYFLVDEGRDLAQKLVALGENPLPSGSLADSYDDASNSNSCNVVLSQQVQYNEDANFELKANTFDIVLVMDQREKIDLINMENSIKIENRTLACGDFIWVARPKGVNPCDRTQDLVLDYVIERKRLDDLASSIFDGRFEQQKMRLLNSGMRRPMYLIEDVGGLRASNLTSSGLAQAVVNILIHDGIGVEKVKNVAHANDYLISMTKCIEKFYLSRNLQSCNQEKLKEGQASMDEHMTFAEFQTKGAKITNWTVREMFAKHLIQINGMSDKRVAVIIKKYPVLSSLVEAYDKCKDDREGELLLAKMQIPDSNRTIGPALSKRVYACYKPIRQLVSDNDDQD